MIRARHARQWSIIITFYSTSCLSKPWRAICKEYSKQGQSVCRQAVDTYLHQAVRWAYSVYFRLARAFVVSARACARDSLFFLPSSCFFSTFSFPFNRRPWFTFGPYCRVGEMFRQKISPGCVLWPLKRTHEMTSGDSDNDPLFLTRVNSNIDSILQLFEIYDTPNFRPSDRIAVQV